MHSEMKDPIENGKNVSLYNYCKDCDTFRHLNNKLLSEGFSAGFGEPYQYIVKYDCLKCHPDAETANDFFTLFAGGFLEMLEKEGGEKALESYNMLVMPWISPPERGAEIMAMAISTVEKYESG